jgi:hypothetical protein
MKRLPSLKGLSQITSLRCAIYRNKLSKRGLKKIARKPSDAAGGSYPLYCGFDSHSRDHKKGNRMQNVVVDAAGHIYVCGENITGDDFTRVPGMGEVQLMGDADLKTCRDQFPACSHGWQFFQILRDNLTLKRDKRRSLAYMAIAIAVIWIFFAASTSWGGMMGDLGGPAEVTISKPEAIHTLNYTSLPTFSIFSKSGVRLVDRAYDIRSGTVRGPVEGVFFYRYGKKGFIKDDGIRIEPELSPTPGQPKVGPRK